MRIRLDFEDKKYDISITYGKRNNNRFESYRSIAFVEKLKIILKIIKSS